MTVETGPLKTGTKKEDLDPRRRETEINSVNSTEKPIEKNPTMISNRVMVTKLLYKVSIINLFSNISFLAISKIDPFISVLYGLIKSLDKNIICATRCFRVLFHILRNVNSIQTDYI